MYSIVHCYEIFVQSTFSLPVQLSLAAIKITTWKATSGTCVGCSNNLPTFNTLSVLSRRLWSCKMICSSHSGHLYERQLTQSSWRGLQYQLPSPDVTSCKESSPCSINVGDGVGIIIIFHHIQESASVTMLHVEMLSSLTDTKGMQT